MLSDRVDFDSFGLPLRADAATEAVTVYRYNYDA